MKLFLLTLLTALVALVTASATAHKPQPATGVISHALKQRQTNREEIAQRELERRGQGHGHDKGEERPKAGPSLGLGRCGGQPMGVRFYIYSRNRRNGDEFYGRYTRGGTNAEFGFLSVTRDPSKAVAFIFDKQCRLRGADGPGQTFTLNSATSIIMMGSDAYVDDMPSTGYHPLTCRSSNSQLSCKNSLVPDNGLICNYEDSYLWFTTRDGAESTGCVPVDLRIRRNLK